MYVLAAPCILDPHCRARGITSEQDLELFCRAIERCRRFSIDIVPLPCPETLYLGADRPPASYLERLNTPDFERLLADLEAEVRRVIAERGPPLCIIGVDSSPTCGVNFTYYDTVKQPGRGAFLARFPDIRAIDVSSFSRYRVYLAGPLFSEAELEYNRTLRDLLLRHFYDVYLPQEVGDSCCTRGKDMHRMIFEKHRIALAETDIMVAVCDGADADSGTAWEMGYAFALQKPVVLLRTDFRRAGHHELVNLMLEESSVVVTKKEEIPVVLDSPLCELPGRDSVVS
jgi:nucleoside 2-deoxyribosyltransferase/predicted secreted protein